MSKVNSLGVSIADWLAIRRLVLMSLALCLISAPSMSSADTHANYFHCLDQASLEYDDYKACTKKLTGYCFERGEDLLDAPPQTECFNAFLTEMKARTAKLAERAEANTEDFKPMFRNASVKHAIRSSQSMCDFLAEVSYKGGKIPGGNRRTPERADLSMAMCRFDAQSVIYWRMFVHDEFNWPVWFPNLPSKYSE